MKTVRISWERTRLACEAWIGRAFSGRCAASPPHASRVRSQGAAHFFKPLKAKADKYAQASYK